MQRIISYTIADIAMDPKEIARSLNHACGDHHDHYRICGISQIDEGVHFILLPTKDCFAKESYVIAPLEDLSDDGIFSELETRWESGFNTIGNIQLDSNTYLALYAREHEEE